MKLSNLLIVSVMFVAAALLTGCGSTGFGSAPQGLLDAPHGIVQKGHQIFENPVYIPFTGESKFVSSMDSITMLNGFPSDYTVTVYKGTRVVVEGMDNAPYEFHPDSPFAGDAIVLTVIVWNPDHSRNMTYTYTTHINSRQNGPLTETLQISPRGVNWNDQHRENYW